MHGQYKSKLVCPDCGKVSITFDPFMSVSLPIPAMNLINLQLYFIYKDSRKVSVKLILNILPNAPASEVNNQVAKILELDENAFELNLLKDHRVIEHKTNKFDVKDLKNHEGMLFGFEIHNDIIDPPLKSFKRENNFRFEIMIKQIKHGDDEEISFSRILYISKDSNAKMLHLNVYMLMRNFIKNYNSIEIDNPFSSFHVDTEKGDLASLDAEYTRFLGVEKDPGLFYTLHYNKRSGLRNVKVELPYDSAIILEELFDNIQEPIFLEIFINKSVKHEILKLNKCQESPGSATANKDSKNFSIYECMDLFTKPELLDKDNLWYCNICKDHKQATKTMEIYKTPKILILHLKRFRTNRVSSIGSFFFTSSSSKISTLVDFPIKGLDLKNYILGKCDENLIYDLFAISNHYGGMGGGHYTAFAKNHFEDAWYDFNDSTVSKQDPNELVTEAAYVLFYKKRDNGKQEQPNSINEANKEKAGISGNDET